MDRFRIIPFPTLALLLPRLDRGRKVPNLCIADDGVHTTRKARRACQKSRIPAQIKLHDHSTFDPLIAHHTPFFSLPYRGGGRQQTHLFSFRHGDCNKYHCLSVCLEEFTGTKTCKYSQCSANASLWWHAGEAPIASSLSDMMLLLENSCSGGEKQQDIASSFKRANRKQIVMIFKASSRNL